MRSLYAKVILPFSACQVGRIPDHDVEPAPAHDIQKLPPPVEGVDPVDLLFGHLGMNLQNIPADQRISALDVLAEVRKRPLLEELQLL